MCFFLASLLTGLMEWWHCSYCRRLVQPTFWGGEPELLVLSQMLKVLARLPGCSWVI